MTLKNNRREYEIEEKITSYKIHGLANYTLEEWLHYNKTSKIWYKIASTKCFQKQSKTSQKQIWHI